MSTRYLSTQGQNGEWVTLLNATILFGQYIAVIENKIQGRIKFTLINIKLNLNGKRTMHHPHEIHTYIRYLFYVIQHAHKVLIPCNVSSANGNMTVYQLTRVPSMQYKE